MKKDRRNSPRFPLGMALWSSKKLAAGSLLFMNPQSAYSVVGEVIPNNARLSRGIFRYSVLF